MLEYLFKQKTPVLESLFDKKHLLEYLFKKVAVLKTCSFIKKSLQRRSFPVNIVKFLRAAFFGIPEKWESRS